MTTATHNYGWLMPDPGGSANTWGNTLNGTTQAIDAKLWSVNSQVGPYSLVLTRAPDPGNGAAINFQDATATQLRWVIGETGETEGAGNAGSNFALNAYDNTGAFLGQAFEAIRATQNMTFPKAVTVGATLTVGGALIANAGLNVTGSVNVSTAVVAGTEIFPCYGTAPNWYLTQSGAYQVHNWASGWVDRWNTSTGERDWMGPGGALMTLDGSGNLATTGGLIVNQGSLNIHVGAATNPTIYLNNNTANVGAVYYSIANGQTVLQELTHGASVFVDAATNLTFNGSGNAFKAGGGPWSATSDARIKDVTGEYQGGLQEVLRLRPVLYRYRGNDAAPGEASPHQHAVAKQFVGFVAQEAELVMPEMVSMHEGYVDGRKVGDLRSVDTSALIFALVNSVKELKAEIEALKAAK